MLGVFQVTVLVTCVIYGTKLFDCTKDYVKCAIILLWNFLGQANKTGKIYKCVLYIFLSQSYFLCFTILVYVCLTQETFMWLYNSVVR